MEILRNVSTAGSTRSAPYSTERMRTEQLLDIERAKSLPITPQQTLDGIVVVGWYTSDDPANPQNWSSFKKSSSSSSSASIPSPFTALAPSTRRRNRASCHISESAPSLLRSGCRSTFSRTASEAFSSLHCVRSQSPGATRSTT